MGALHVASLARDVRGLRRAERRKEPVAGSRHVGHALVLEKASRTNSFLLIHSCALEGAGRATRS